MSSELAKEYDRIEKEKSAVERTRDILANMIVKYLYEEETDEMHEV